MIGNPPYVRIQSIDRTEADYYRSIYESASGSFDLYVLFLERALMLLKPEGRLGFITSGKFLKSTYGKKVQEVLLRETTVDEIVDLSSHKVFAEATNYPVILMVRKGAGNGSISYKSVSSLDAESPVLDLSTMPNSFTAQRALASGMWPPATAETIPVLNKLESESERFGRVASNVFTGLQTSADRVYHLHERGEQDGALVKVFSTALEKEVELESDVLKPLLSGKHISRYVASPSGVRLLFPYKVEDRRAQLIPADEFSERYPLCWEYLLENRTVLEGRERGKMRHDRWYAYVYPKNLALHVLPKLATPRLVHRLEVFYDARGQFYLDNVDVGGVLLKEPSPSHYLYVLALLNNRLMNWYFQRLSAPFRGGFRSANRQFIEPLPVRRVDSPADKQLHDAIVAKVERMLEIQSRLGPILGVPTSERDELNREADRVDSQIDELVYELYGVTQEERKMVEGE